MKAIISIVFLLLLNNNYSLGQRNLTKEEIFQHWNSPSERQIRDSVAIVNSDSVLNVNLTKLVDSLQANNIDSIIVISTAYPGYISTSKCDTGMFPITSFIIWNSGGIPNARKLNGSCSSEITLDLTSDLFSFYGDNDWRLQSESFMPVILGGKINRDKKVSYSMSWIDHEPNYSFYYNIRQHQKSFHFCQSYLDSKESLFKNYNLSLSAYHWWQQVKKATDKFD